MLPTETQVPILLIQLGRTAPHRERLNQRIQMVKWNLAGAAGFEPANAGTKSQRHAIYGPASAFRDPQKSADFDSLADQFTSSRKNPDRNRGSLDVELSRAEASSVEQNSSCDRWETVSGEPPCIATGGAAQIAQSAVWPAPPSWHEPDCEPRTNRSCEAPPPYLPEIPILRSSHQAHTPRAERDGVRFRVLRAVKWNWPNAVVNFVRPRSHDLGKSGGGQQLRQHASSKVARLFGQGFKEPLEFVEAEYAVSCGLGKSQIPQTRGCITIEPDLEAAQAGRPSEKHLEFGSEAVGPDLRRSSLALDKADQILLGNIEDRTHAESWRDIARIYL
jgi:hypothetical protein